MCTTRIRCRRRTLVPSRMSSQHGDMKKLEKADKKGRARQIVSFGRIGDTIGENVPRDNRAINPARHSVTVGQNPYRKTGSIHEVRRKPFCQILQIPQGPPIAVPAFLGGQARPSPECVVQPPALDQPPFQAARTNYDELDATDTVQILVSLAVPSRHHPSSHPRVQQKRELRGSTPGLSHETNVKLFHGLGRLLMWHGGSSITD